MEKRLNKEEIIKLINLYRNHEILWNMLSKLYRRTDLKIKAFENIASEMSMPVDIVKKKIRSLRSTYTGEKKKTQKKSGSSTEDIYESSLFWFNEMNFLDNSIAVRSSCDNSNNIGANSENFEDYIEESSSYECEYSFSSKKPIKRAGKELSKFDEALQNLIDVNNKENEFTAFGTSIALQLLKFPEEEAYELMGMFQNVLVERKLKNSQKRRFNAEDSTYSSDNLPECSSSKKRIVSFSMERSSTPLAIPKVCQSTTPFSNILNRAIADAEIDFSD